MKFKQGYFSPKNTVKYVGEINNIFYRSGLEFRFMTICDLSERVLKWSSEPFRIKYYHPVEKRDKNYIVDFWVEIIDNQKQKRKILIEIKPSSQTIKPIEPKRKTEKSKKRFMNESVIYIQNIAKWSAAKEVCDKLGWDFFIITEKNLNILK